MFNKFKEQFSKHYLLEIEYLKNDISILEEEVYSLNKQIVELNASIDSLKIFNSNLISLYGYYPSTKVRTIYIACAFMFAFIFVYILDKLA